MFETKEKAGGSDDGMEVVEEEEGQASMCDYCDTEISGEEEIEKHRVRCWEEMYGKKGLDYVLGDYDEEEKMTKEVNVKELYKKYVGECLREGSKSENENCPSAGNPSELESNA